MTTSKRDREPAPPMTLFGFPVRLELELEPGLVVIVPGAQALNLNGPYTSPELDLDAILAAVNDARMRQALSPARVRLELTEAEAAELHAAIRVTCELLAQVEPGAGAALQRSSRPRLQRISERLDHERRHRGAIPNPNGP